MAEFKTSDGTIINYIDQGNGQPLLLIHGYGCTNQFFKRNIPELSSRFRVIAVNLRGHGNSNQVSSGPRISKLATDVHELIEALNLDDATYLGWSMGASVGWGYWELFKNDRIGRFIFVDEPALAASSEENPTGAMSMDDLSGFQQRMREQPDNTIQTFIQSLLHKKDNDIDDLIASAQLGNAEFLSQLIFNHHVMNWSDVLPTINIPSLVISGVDSLVNGITVKRVSDQIPGSKFAQFKDAGHMMFFEYPQEFNQLITDFIDAN